MKLLLAVILLAGINGRGFCAEAETSSSRLSGLRMWFQHLKEGLADSAVSGHRQKTRVTAVAAVRGSAQDVANPNEPAWKRDKTSAKIPKAERTELSRAVDLILEGKNTEGVAALDAFEKAHPKSHLLGEVRDARQKAVDLQAAAAESPVKIQ